MKYLWIKQRITKKNLAFVVKLW